MKKIYEVPAIELVTFQAEENITASVQGQALFGLFPSDLVGND